MAYTAPLRDIQFVLKELAGLEALATLPGCEDATADLVDAILEEGAKFASGVLAPLNHSGDKEGARWEAGEVHTAAGWKAAYQAFAEAGWSAIGSPLEFGGQGLPTLVASAVAEMFKSANMAFSLCPMLTQGAIEAIVYRGSAALKAKFLPKMVAGEWTGTMNLTEPQAGSDLSAVRARAEPQADGSYRVFGQKIFITYGEHDLAANIIHLVLARLPDAPEGVKGISLFVVPKFLVGDDGQLGARNDVHCVSIEHKLGIHASPTCVLSFGDHGGAQGYLVGEAHRGIEYMFIMMNMARFNVGLEGLAISERAYQHALAYARERVQGVDSGVRGAGRVAIIAHPDVRRMLMLMKSNTEAMRALAYVTAAKLDAAHRHPEAAHRASAQAFADLMIPVVKAWSTETGIEMASLGIQIHGGMGYIEETGAAQYLRDARITTIYEGTTGIQANDLVGRKIARDSGACASAVLDEIDSTVAALEARDNAQLQAIAVALAQAASATAACVQHICAHYAIETKAVLVGAVPFLRLFGITAGAWQLARGALAAERQLAAGEGDAAFLRAKLHTAAFYAEHVLSQAGGLAHSVQHGAEAALEMDVEQF